MDGLGGLARIVFHLQAMFPRFIVFLDSPAFLIKRSKEFAREGIGVQWRGHQDFSVSGLQLHSDQSYSHRLGGNPFIVAEPHGVGRGLYSDGGFLLTRLIKSTRDVPLINVDTRAKVSRM